jgi:hypothetical protein
VENWLHTGSLGALALGQFVPAAVLSGARMLLRQGLRLNDAQLEQGKTLARRSIEQLDGLRLKLQHRLELELAKAEQRWSPGEPPSPGFETLRLAAQKLADQLSEVEELEGRLERMLENGQ